LIILTQQEFTHKEACVEALFFVFVPLIIGLWVLTINLDKDRVRKNIEANGHSVLTVHWKLFGHGWLSESSKGGGGNRIYEVEYRDVYRNTHRVWAKTAMLSGVFLSEDRIVVHATVAGGPMTAEEKVLVLEEELRKARAQQ
jgi:hypothetical protein